MPEVCLSCCVHSVAVLNDAFCMGSRKLSSRIVSMGLSHKFTDDRSLG